MPSEVKIKLIAVFGVIVLILAGLTVYFMHRDPPDLVMLDELLKLETSATDTNVKICGVKLGTTKSFVDDFLNRTKIKAAGSHPEGLYQLVIQVNNTQYDYVLGMDSLNKIRNGRHLFWLYSAEGTKVGSPLAYIRSQLVSEFIKNNCENYN